MLDRAGDLGRQAFDALAIIGFFSFISAGRFRNAVSAEKQGNGNQIRAFLLERGIAVRQGLVGAKDIEVFGQHGSDSIQPADPLTSV
jgi:hypothetical protein